MKLVMIMVVSVELQIDILIIGVIVFQVNIFQHVGKIYYMMNLDMNKI